MVGGEGVRGSWDLCVGLVRDCVVLPWYGTSVVLPWRFRLGSTTEVPRKYHGRTTEPSVALPWYFRGTSVVLPSLKPKRATVVLPWYFRGTSVVLPWYGGDVGGSLGGAGGLGRVHKRPFIQVEIST